MDKQTIFKIMNPINQPTIANTGMVSYNTFSIKHAPKDYTLDGYFQTGDYAQRGLGQTVTTANNDNINAKQCKQLYGNMTYNYINYDNYSGAYDKNMDIQRSDITSAHLPYYVPDTSQRPLYQWQSNYSSFRPFKQSDLYKKTGTQSIESYTNIQNNKNNIYTQKYRK